MAVQKLYQPRVYRPMSDDPHLRRSIERIIQRDSGIPRKIAEEYPQRGEDIYKQTRLKVTNGDRSIRIINSPLTLQSNLDHLLVVMSYWGTNTTRETVTKQALNYLVQMNPLPKIVFVEGSVDGNYRFRDVTNLGIHYIPIDLQPDCFRNLFMKEILWNYGVKKMLETDPTIAKICYLDSDCVFMDKYAFSEVDHALDSYDVISPMRAAYYADDDELNGKYGLLHSMGFNMAIKASKYGWQGFGLAVNVSFLQKYFNYELPCSSLGFGDCIFWWLLAGKAQMKNFRQIPYDKKKLEAYMLPNTIRVGYANTILMHLFHGTITDRQYQVKCRLVQRSIIMPFTDLGRLENGLLGWNSTPDTRALRNCLEWLLIFNRQDIKLMTPDDANQLYDWVTGISPCPPKKVRQTPFAPNGNELPNHGVSRPVMNPRSEI